MSAGCRCPHRRRRKRQINSRRPCFFHVWNFERVIPRSLIRLNILLDAHLRLSEIVAPGAATARCRLLHDRRSYITRRIRRLRITCRIACAEFGGVPPSFSIPDLLAPRDGQDWVVRKNSGGFLPLDSASSFSKNCAIARGRSDEFVQNRVYSLMSAVRLRGARIPHAAQPPCRQRPASCCISARLTPRQTIHRRYQVRLALASALLACLMGRCRTQRAKSHGPSPRKL